MQSNSRRKFITDSAIIGMGTVTGASLLGSILSSCHTSRNTSSPHSIITGFDQAPLPYAYNALEPWIDAETMDIHYNKHAAAYSKNLKEAAMAENVDTKKPLEELLPHISQFSVKMRNNAGGHYNHEFFWQLLAANKPDLPTGSLLKSIEKYFGSLIGLKDKFNEAAKARFGSGWAWVVYTNEKKLVVTSTANQDNPLMDLHGTGNEIFINGIPLIGIDVWEHAYYLKYRNRRAEYIDNFWKILNWEFVQKRWELIS